MKEEGAHTHTITTTGNHSHSVGPSGSHSHTFNSTGEHSHVLESSGIHSHSGAAALVNAHSHSLSKLGTNDGGTHFHYFEGIETGHTLIENQVQQTNNSPGWVSINYPQASVTNATSLIYDGTGGHVYQRGIESGTVSTYDLKTSSAGGHVHVFSIGNHTHTVGADSGHAHTLTSGDHTHSVTSGGGHSHSTAISSGHSHTSTENGAHSHSAYFSSVGGDGSHIHSICPTYIEVFAYRRVS